MKVGDGVVLKNSRGPILTVTEIDGSNVECRWFEKGKLNHGAFPAEALEPPPPRGPRMIRARFSRG